jgi:hypothetical protein
MRERHGLADTQDLDAPETEAMEHAEDQPQRICV